MKNTFKAIFMVSILGCGVLVNALELDNIANLNASEETSKAAARGRGTILAQDLKGLSADSQKRLKTCKPEKFQTGHRNLNYYKETVQCAAATLLLDRQIELADISFIIRQLNNLATAIKAYQPADVVKK